MYSFNELKQSLAGTVQHFKGELATIRSGRAAPALLDAVRVESYGALVPLNQVANVSVEDARTIRITPWDKASVKAIEKAVAEANLGVSAGSDERGVRVSFPELTSERREQLVKLTRAKLEEARVMVRQHRDKTWTDIQKKQKDSELSEDEKFTAKEEMEKVVSATNQELEALAEKKEEELKA